MKLEAEYDEFFAWVDEKMGNVVVPQFFPELEGYTLSASDFLADQRKIVKRPNGRNEYYCDALYELWKQHKFTAKTVKDAQSSAKQGKNVLINGKIPC